MLVELDEEDVNFLKKFLKEELDGLEFSPEPDFMWEVPHLKRILKKLKDKTLKQDESN